MQRGMTRLSSRAPPVQRRAQTPRRSQSATPMQRSVSPTRIAGMAGAGQDSSAQASSRTRTTLRSLGLRRTHYTPEPMAPSKPRSQRLRKVRQAPEAAEGPTCGKDDLSIWSMQYGRGARLVSDSPDPGAQKRQQEGGGGGRFDWFWRPMQRGSVRLMPDDEEGDQK